MAPWNPAAMPWSEYVENVMVQVDRRLRGESYCEDPNNPLCKCDACEEAEEKSGSWEIFLIDNPSWRDIMGA